MWTHISTYTIATQLLNDCLILWLLMFETLWRRSWRVVPSHGGPWGFEHVGVRHALTCLTPEPNLRNLGWNQSSDCICWVQLRLFWVVGVTSKPPLGLFQQNKQQLLGLALAGCSGEKWHLSGSSQPGGSTEDKAHLICDAVLVCHLERSEPSRSFYSSALLLLINISIRVKWSTGPYLFVY